jgi:hypothetical protein
MRLQDIADVLGCSKATVSRVARGIYDKESDLPVRYAALMRLIDEARAQSAPERICVHCPREDCTGCRVAEL